MKTKNLFLMISILCIAVFVAACDSKPMESEVPYTELKRYFFRNDAEMPTNPKIETRERFDSLFGVASVLGGLPTEIDFARQFVIAVVLPATNKDTKIEGKSLLYRKDLLGKPELTFEYDVQRDEEPLSFTMQPILLIGVDRKYKADKVSVREIVDQ